MLRIATQDVKMDRGHNVICVLTTKDLLRSFSVGEMHHIRQIMIQHEELFKEQVRTLHKLYQVQKSAMHDIERILFHQNGTPNGKVCSPLFERKPTSDYSIYGLNYKKANYPLLDGEAELTGAKKYLHGTCKEHEYSPEVQKRKIQKIDLEKTPEEYMDEVDSPFEQNSYIGESKHQGFQQDLLEKFQYNSSISVGRDAVCEESKIPLNTGNPNPLPSQPLYPLRVGICSSDLQTEDQSGSSHHSSTTAKFDGLNVGGNPDKFNVPKILVPNNTANSCKCGTCESALVDPVKLDQAQFSFEKEAQPSSNACQNSSACCANMVNIAEDSVISLNGGHKNSPELVADSKNLESGTDEQGLTTVGNEKKVDDATSKDECDTIAANILLSFVTFRSDSSPKMQCARPQAEANHTEFDIDAKHHHGKKLIQRKGESCTHVKNDNVVRSRRSRLRRRNNRG